MMYKNISQCLHLLFIENGIHIFSKIFLKILRRKIIPLVINEHLYILTEISVIQQIHKTSVWHCAVIQIKP